MKFDLPFSLARHLLVLLAAFAAVLTTSGLPQGAPGIFLIAAGGVLLLAQPRAKVGWRWFGGAAALTGCAVLALLPRSWRPMPAWRSDLLAAAVPLGGQISPVPLETLFWVALLAISALLLIHGLSHPLHSRHLLALAVLGVVAVTVYAGMAIYARMTGWGFRFDFDEAFGFFPNRNNTAALLVSGSLLALGVLGVAREGKHWFAGTVATVGLAVNIAALFFFAGSRGGVVFLILGTLLWLIGLGGRHWSRPVVVSFAAIFCACLVLFSVSHGEARHRLLGFFDPSASSGKVRPAAGNGVERQESTPEGRLLIYQDTWKMICEFPATGVGLGAFRYVFPFYRGASLTEARSLHPESDWLMLASEAGLPALLVAAAGLLGLLRNVLQERDHPYWPLRFGIVCAVLAVSLHGWVDVPVHRTALGFWILVLAGAGFARFSQTPEPSPLAQRLIFGGAGVAAITLGILLIRAEWFGGNALPPWAAEQAQKRIEALSKQGKDEEAMEVAARAIRQSPMAYDLYYMAGVLKLNFENTDAEVDSLFAAQRALSPTWPQISIEQGQAWLTWDQARTASVWQDALERQRRIDRVRDRMERHDLGLFQNLLALSPLRPDVQRRLLSANQSDPQMVLIWMEQVDKAVAGPEILRLSRDEAFLGTLDEQLRRRLLRAWSAKADHVAMEAFTKSHPAWSTAAWPFIVRQMVESRQFERAITTVVDHYQLNLDFAALLSAAPPDTNRSDDDPVASFIHYWQAGNQISARRILQEAQQPPPSGPEVPAEVWRLAAALSIHEGRWEEAWPQVVHYLQKSGVDGASDFR